MLHGGPEYHIANSKILRPPWSILGFEHELIGQSNFSPVSPRREHSRAGHSPNRPVAQDDLGKSRPGPAVSGPNMSVNGTVYARRKLGMDRPEQGSDFALVEWLRVKIKRPATHPRRSVERSEKPPLRFSRPSFFFHRNFAAHPRFGWYVCIHNGPTLAFESSIPRSSNRSSTRSAEHVVAVVCPRTAITGSRSTTRTAADETPDLVYYT